MTPLRPEASARGPRKPRGRFARWAFVLVATVLFFGLIALGTWQLERRAWKLALIAKVEQRVHAAAVPAPTPDQWPAVNTAADEYRRVQVSGSFIAQAQAFVQAVTERGPGYWMVVPLRAADRSVVLINRGFVTAEQRDRLLHAAPNAAPPVTVTGLLRMTEPGGAFLRHNDPAADRWYSRDVQAIAAARGLTRVAPYFVDAEAAAGSAPEGPVGGLTVIAFHNSHLVYAITWYTLALMAAGAVWRVLREERRRLRAGSHGGASHG